MKKLPIYFDHAATTPLNDEVYMAMEPLFKENFGNTASRHHAHGWLANDKLEDCYKIIDKYLHLPASQFLFTSGASESINTVLKGFVEQYPKGEIISIKTEHKATIDTLNFLESKGHKITYTEIDENGEVVLEALEKRLKKKGPKLVSISWVNSETGVVQPIEHIGSFKIWNDFLFHVDGTQAIGKVHCNFAYSYLDYVSFSAHKINGPKGIGGLVFKKPLSKYIHGGSQQYNFRAGTINLPAVVGFCEAIKHWIENKQSHQLHFTKLALRLKNYLPDFNGKISLNAPNAIRSHAIVNLRVHGFDSEKLLEKLSHGFSLSNGSACNLHSVEPSYVLLNIGQTKTAASEAIRVSFGPSNTFDEIDAFYLELKKHVL